MDGKVKEYNKIYTDKPDKWAGEPGRGRDMLAYYYITRHMEQPETVLDIGCGNGHTIEYLKKTWPDTVFYGFDISDVAIDIAKEKVPDAEFMAGDFRDFTLYCDVVLVMGVAEHFEKLTEGLRALKEYGKLIYLEVPDCLFAGKLNGSKYNKEGFRRTYKGGLQEEWHLTRASWEQRIKMAGLEIMEYGSGPDIVTFVWVLK